MVEHAGDGELPFDVGEVDEDVFRHRWIVW
jgi:hypothetical protein